DVLDLPNF
ncbi:hypothetical protein RRG08_020960, partial [Elysia crispata]